MNLKKLKIKGTAILTSLALTGSFAVPVLQGSPGLLHGIFPAGVTAAAASESENTNYRTDLKLSDCPKLKSATLPRNPTFNIKYSGLGYLSYFDRELMQYINEKIEDFTIYGYTGTEAENYANENGFKFIDRESIILGDIDGNYVIDAADAAHALRMYTLTQTGRDVSQYYTEKALISADVDKNRVIYASDAAKILKYYAYVQTTGGKVMTSEEFFA